jgi:hypothetical protein
MSHLTLEDLARIIDDEAAAHEAAHLDACEQCRRELDAMREDVQALAMLPDMVTAPDSWAAIEQRLGAEGLIRPRAAATGFRYARIAAAVVLFLAGSMAGRITAGTAERPLAHEPPAPAPVYQTPAGPAPLSQPAYVDAGDVADAAAPAPQARPAASRQSPVSFAANGSRTAQPRTVEEAAELLRQTEELYLTALTRFAELAMQSEQGDPIARLAALQSIVMTTQAALSQAPTDPVINGYHLTALAQRDAALRQVAAVTNDRWY